MNYSHKPITFSGGNQVTPHSLATTKSASRCSGSLLWSWVQPTCGVCVVSFPWLWIYVSSKLPSGIRPVSSVMHLAVLYYVGRGIPTLTNGINRKLPEQCLLQKLSVREVIELSSEKHFCLLFFQEKDPLSSFCKIIQLQNKFSIWYNSWLSCCRNL